MKSLKDAIDLYRTLIAEGLSEFSYSERGEALGRRLDDAAWRLSRKVALPRKPTDMSEAWQQMGHLTDEGVNFGALIEDVERHSADLARRYLDGVAAHLYVGPSGEISEYFKAKEAPLVARTQAMTEALRPQFEEVARILGDAAEVEWREPTSRTAGAVEDSRKALNLPDFTDFSATINEVYGPEFSRMQDMINDMVRRHSREHEWAFLREVEEVTGFRHGLSDLPATVDDNPTT